MGNLNVNNYHNLKMRINHDEYWDFFINKDTFGYYSTSSASALNENGLISYIDLCDSACTDGSSWLYAKSGYTWEDAVAIDNTLYNISYLGVDNGLFTFRKDRITNADFVKLFQSNSYTISENDVRLKLHAVSGNTLQYEYPLHIEECQAILNGGFFQGFFKTECDKYQVLPTSFDDGDTYNFEFVLNKCDLEKESNKTLNDKYPNNKGIFFYVGTRAENKWIYLYDEDDIDGLESCTELGVDDYVDGGEIDKKDYIIGNFYDIDDFEVPQDPPLDMDDYTDFVWYDREYEPIDACDWEDMSDYLDIDYEKKLKPIDENTKKEVLGWCCNGEDDGEYEVEYSLVPFFRGCGCPVRYKKVVTSVTDYDGDPTPNGCDYFGGDYIGDLDSMVDEDHDYIESEVDITDFEYYTDNGFNLAEGNQYYFYTDNKFLMFDRTKDGKNVGNWVEGTEFMYYGRKSHFNGNLFILMNRTKTGYTVNTIDSLRDENANYYDPYKDIYDNALAFRITDNGEIGYRFLTVGCDKEGRDKASILEGYSNENVIPNCEWSVVNVRLSFVGGDKMKLMFYVNGKLVYITKELPRLKLKALDEIYEKQEGVPYNMSLGGGTQGLAETIQRNYMLNPSRVYPLEQYFAGSFIGYMKSFKIYNEFMESLVIQNNFNYETKKWE